MLEILFEDLESFFRKEDEKEMVYDLRSNVVRNTKIFTEIVHRMLPPRNTPISEEEVGLRLFRRSRPSFKTYSIFRDATTCSKRGFPAIKWRGFPTHLSMDCNSFLIPAKSTSFSVPRPKFTLTPSVNSHPTK